MCPLPQKLGQHHGPVVNEGELAGLQTEKGQSQSLLRNSCPGCWLQQAWSGPGQLWPLN